MSCVFIQMVYEKILFGRYLRSLRGWGSYVGGGACPERWLAGFRLVLSFAVMIVGYSGCDGCAYVAIFQ